MRSQIQPDTSRLTMPNAEHQRQHLRAARRTVAEVAAVGDDVDLRHRHRDAAAQDRRCTAAPAGRGERPNGRDDGVTAPAPLPRSDGERRLPAAQATRAAAWSRAQKSADAECRSGASRRSRRSAARSAARRRRPGSCRWRRSPPRCRAGASNQSEMSATSGANVAELPRKPMSRPCTSANSSEPAASRPGRSRAPRPIAPTGAAAITPKRSARRPIRMPPKPKPSIVSV